jgi:hypothetical protein
MGSVELVRKENNPIINKTKDLFFYRNHSMNAVDSTVKKMAPAGEPFI